MLIIICLQHGCLQRLIVWASLTWPDPTQVGSGHASRTKFGLIAQIACSCISVTAAECNTALESLGPRVPGSSVYSVPSSLPNCFPCLMY